MSRAAHLVLILCLTLTSIGLGAARGTVRIDGQIVLCSGQTVRVALDGQGHPTGTAHLCPDMALAQMAAMAEGAPQVPPLPGTYRPMDLPAADRAAPGRAAPAGRARGPPGGTFTVTL